MRLASKYLLHAPRQKRVHEDIHPLRCGYDTFIQSDSPGTRESKEVCLYSHTCPFEFTQWVLHHRRSTD